MIFRYVPHAMVRNYELLGWKDRGYVPGHHGVWSRIMIWQGKGEPIEPEAARVHESVGVAR